MNPNLKFYVQIVVNIYRRGEETLCLSSAMVLTLHSARVLAIDVIMNS